MLVPRWLYRKLYLSIYSSFRFSPVQLGAHSLSPSASSKTIFLFFLGCFLILYPYRSQYHPPFLTPSSVTFAIRFRASSIFSLSLRHKPNASSSFTKVERGKLIQLFFYWWLTLLVILSPLSISEFVLQVLLLVFFSSSSQQTYRVNPFLYCRETLLRSFLLERVPQIGMMNYEAIPVGGALVLSTDVPLFQVKVPVCYQPSSISLLGPGARNYLDQDRKKNRFPFDRTSFTLASHVGKYTYL